MKSKEALKDGNRLIRKYPNRRLYDTVFSGYVPFSHLKDLVRNGVGFYVEDVKTGEDVTRIVLINMIQEENLLDNVPFSEQFLRSIISFYGNANQGLMGAFLEIALKNIANTYETALNQSKGLNDSQRHLEQINNHQKNFAILLEKQLNNFLKIKL